MGSGHVDDPLGEGQLDQDKAIAKLEKQIADRAADREEQAGSNQNEKDKDDKV